MSIFSPFGQLRIGLQSGKKFVNGFCSTPSPVIAELLARQGFDCVTIDLQHGLIDYQTSLAMLQAVGVTGLPTLCRVPWNDPIPVMKALDAGFEGIICPMINNRKEAEKFASYVRYAPRGVRSFGPTRALNSFGPTYSNTANDQIVNFVMVETATAIDNLEEILAVDEVDGIYIGPADLSLSLGFAPSLVVTEKRVLDAIEHILSVVQKQGKFAGIHCSGGATVGEMIGRGFNLATIATDVRIFVAAVKSEVEAARRQEKSPIGSSSAY
jgi:4-hydroxy-2-oxoheptanedioate aldolase